MVYTISPPLNRSSRPNSIGTVSKEKFLRVLLTVSLYVSFWRATGMWYGYPARFDEGVSVDPLPMKILLYSLIISMGIYIFIERDRIYHYILKINKDVMIVILFVVLSIPGSIDFGASARGLAAVGLLTIAPLFYRLRYGSVETLRALTNFAIVAAFANLLYLIVFPHFAIMGGSYAGMVKGLFYHKNGLGQYSAVAFIILMSSTSTNERLTYRKLMRLMALAITLVFVLLSRSSTAVVMLGVGLSTLMGLRVIQSIRHSAARATVILFLFIGLGVTISLAYVGVAQSVAAAFGKDLTFSGRSDIWDLLLPLVYDRPFLGHGFATFRQASILERYVVLSHDVRSVHNTYLELCLNIGVIGTFAWVLFLFKRLVQKINSFQSGKRERRSQAKEIVIILLVMIGAMMEAGMMLAPVVMWPILMISLPKRVEPLLETRRRTLARAHPS